MGLRKTMQQQERRLVALAAEAGEDFRAVDGQASFLEALEPAHQAPLARKRCRLAPACRRTAPRMIGVQPSSTPGVPSAWRDQAQKSKRSLWRTIRPAALKSNRES